MHRTQQEKPKFFMQMGIPAFNPNENIDLNVPQDDAEIAKLDKLQEERKKMQQQKAQLLDKIRAAEQKVFFLK